MKRKILYAVIGVLVIGCAAFVVHAKSHKGKRAHKSMAALNLTDEQKTTLEDLKTEHQKAMIDLRAAYQKARLDLREARTQDNPTASDIQAKIDALMAAQGKIMAHEIQRDMAIRNVLTPEQREKLGEMHPRGGRKGFRGRGGHRFRGRGGPWMGNHYGFRGRGGFHGRRGWHHDHSKKQSEMEDSSEHTEKQ